MNDKQYTLLYAEDESSVREIYANVMNMYFKEVYEAKDGEEALKLYKDKKPDVLLLDIEMPKLDGLEVAEEIRKEDKSTKIIFLTAHSDRERLLKALHLNISDYLIKPITRKVTQTTLEKVFDELSKDKSSNVIFLDNKLRFKLDQLNGILYKDNEFIDLTKYERDLLKLFCSKQNQIVSKQDIFEAVYSTDQSEYKDVNVRNLVKSLRKKLPEGILNSVYGKGYIFNII